MAKLVRALGIADIDGGEPAAAVNVVIPSLPGFGFSVPLSETGWSYGRFAPAFAALMARPGYDRYGVRGGDVGAIVALLIGQIDAEHVVGVPMTAGDESLAESAQEIIGALTQLVERAHERDIVVFGGTIFPFEGTTWFTPDGDAKRQPVNDWIRTSGAFDAVVDFDAATRDPSHPTRLLPECRTTPPFAPRTMR